MTSTKNIPNFDLLAKYFAGEASAMGKAEVERWRDNDHVIEFNKIKSAWFAFENLPYEFDTENALGKVNKKIDSKKLRSITWYSSVAAVAIILVVWQLFIPLHHLVLPDKKMVTIELYDTIVNHILADGSEVYVNTNSTIKHSKNFNKNRTVILSGEAYFNVNPTQHSSPFVVKAKEIQVVVVGTKFNVHAFPNSDTLTITVTNGRVKVLNADGELISKLTENQQLKYNTTTKEAFVEALKQKENFFWQIQILEFENTPLSEVAEILRKVFRVSIEIKAQNLDSLRITTTFEDNSLDEILHIISLTLDLDISQEKETILIRDAEK